jgi:tRNA dimethylallyltransferase
MPIDARPCAIFLMGPTASGKTALACKLSERFPVELVSVDSALVYRGLDIGAAKPDAPTLARYPHRLIDIREPSQNYSAGDFVADALAAMDEIVAQRRVPLLVGGTGLYFRALQFGLSSLPRADAGLRAELECEARDLGLPLLHERLARLDPLAASRIRASDPQRLLRALEVIALTGRPLSEQQQGGSGRLAYRLLKLALLPLDRAPLHARIAQRFDSMLADGFLGEVGRLRARGDLRPDLSSIRAVGYRQAWEHLDGATDAATFRDRAVFATRQLAKRQITWLRSERDALAFDPEATDVAALASRAVEAFLPARQENRAL